MIATAGSLTRRRQVAQKFLAAELFLCWLMSSGAVFAFSPPDIRFNEHHDPFLVYNFVLPDLMRFAAFDPEDPPGTKILKAVRYVNFFTTIERYEYRMGLRVVENRLGWWDHLSWWFASGNILCSEQAGTAAKMLLPWFPQQAFRDVREHTFFEVQLDGRWVIVDPMFDMRIRNKSGQPASFEDIQAYCRGETGSLRLPPEIFPSMRDYLDRYREERIRENKAERHAFGSNLAVYPENSLEPMYDLYKGRITREFLSSISRDCYFEEQSCPQYLLYVRNNIHEVLMNSADRKKDLKAFQDHFLDSIARFHMGNGAFDKKYYARNMMLLGRLEEAQAYLDSIDEKDEQAYYFLSLIHFLRRDAGAFNALGKQCGENPYYRYLYWQLNQKYFAATDPEDFKNFWSRNYGLDLQGQDGLFQLQGSN